MSRITAFLEGRGPDNAGRGIETILTFGPTALERHHDFIQWLFPLMEPSRAVAGSPVLSQADIAALRSSAVAQRNLARAEALMTRFYTDEAGWLRSADHNHLRITRIIRSLRLLVDDVTADAFRATILRLVATAGDPVSTDSRAYWMAA